MDQDTVVLASKVTTGIGLQAKDHVRELAIAAFFQLGKLTGSEENLSSADAVGRALDLSLE